MTTSGKTESKIKEQDQGARGGKEVWTVERVAPDRIAKSPTNPRKTFPEAAQEELLESVRMQGIINPLIVRKMPRWELVAPDLVEKDWRITKDGKVVEAIADKFLQDAGKAEQDARTRFKKLAGFEAVGPGGALKKPTGLADYELVAGERRWRVAMKLNLATVPVIVRALNDDEVEELQIIENLQREDVSALEEAEQYRKMIDSGRYTAETLAGKIGKSRSHVFGRLKLCKLSPKAREAVAEGKIDPSAAGLISTVADPGAQKELVKLASEGKFGRQLSFRELQEQVKSRQRNLSAAPWKWQDEELVPAAGSCTACPKRGGNIAGWEGSPNVCTDVGCYERKDAAALKVLEKRCQERGVKMLPRGNSRYWFEKGKPYEYGNSVTDPLAKVPGDKKKRTWMGIFDGVPTIEFLVHVCDDQGKWGDWILTETAHAKARELGIMEKERSGGGDAQWKAQRERAQRRRQLAAAVVIPAIVAAAEKGKTTVEWLRALAEDEGYAHQVMERRGLKAAEFKKVLGKMGEGELRGFITEAVLCGNPADYTGGWSKEFLAVCELFGVEVEKLEAAAKKDAESGKAAKGKGKK